MIIYDVEIKKNINFYIILIINFKFTIKNIILINVNML